MQGVFSFASGVMFTYVAAMIRVKVCLIRVYLGAASVVFDLLRQVVKIRVSDNGLGPLVRTSI